jgi:uncharacterized protein YggE
VNVIGEAEREVVPDRAVVAVSIRTPTLPSPAEALALGVARRARVREALAAAVADATVSDARVTTAAEHEHIEEPDARGRVVSRSVVRGHYGICELRVEAEAARAAAIVGAAGSNPDVAAVRPGFTISTALRRAVERELEQDAVRDALARGAALAEAAGMRSGEVLAIGEPPATADLHEGRIILASMQMDDGALQEAIGELVPEAQTLSARVPVSLALMPAG